MASRRPPNRKAQIRATASDLFQQRGYHSVTMTDVAGALGIAPSALYHHYRSKQELLLQTILEGLDNLDARIREATDLDTALWSLATLVVGPRSVLPVWEREARYLDDAQREAIRGRETEVAQHLATLARGRRPGLTEPTAELLGWAILGAVGSRSRFRNGASLPQRRAEQVAHRLGDVTAHAGLAVERPGGPPPEPEVTTDTTVARPRRDQLLTEAIRLFDERGFHSVTMADIGSAAGIAGPGVYRHFAGKSDILVAAMNRGSERLRAAADEALARAHTPREALELLLRAHIDVAVEHIHLLGILANERDQLPEKERTTLRRLQADYLALWVEALRGVVPDREPAQLKVVIHAAQAMIYIVVRSGRTDQWPGLTEQLFDVGMSLLVDSWTPR